MNFRFVINQIGLLMVVLSGVMAGVAAWAVAEWLIVGQLPVGSTGLMLSAALGVVVGGGMYLGTKRNLKKTFGRREAMLLVAFSWFLGAAVAGLPYLFWAHLAPDAPADHPFRSYVDCYFEAMSGLTTTGATVLTDIEAVPPTLLLWRALTQWLGGLGIVVLFVAVLPSLGVGARKLFSFEMSGPTQGGVRPRIQETAKTLWIIYTGFTVIAIVLLRLCGMAWFDAFCHGFSTLAIGGFSPHNASVGGYNSTAVNIVIITFMVIAGINFGVYFQLFNRAGLAALRDTETRVYLAMLAIASVLVIGTLLVVAEPITTTAGEALDPTVANAVEHGLFNTVALGTTTGFASADFDEWPFFARAVLIAAMIMGGCAGSTAGGLKIVRVWIMFKVIYTELERAFHPHVIRPTRVGKATIDSDLKLAVLAYVIGILMLCAGGAVVVMMLEINNPEADFTTAATASIATTFNIGPGFAAVGPIAHFGWMSAPTKIFLSLMMVLGRLEVFAILVLFMPRFWKTS